MGYLTNFMVYTLAMVGVMFVALLVFKKSTSFNGSGNSKHLRVIDSMSLGQRKMLYIVSAGKEKFLIAGDTDRTSLISKLENTKEYANIVSVEQEAESGNITSSQASFKDTLLNLPKQSYMDKTNVGITSSLLNKTNKNTNISVMKNIADILRK